MAYRVRSLAGPVYPVQDARSEPPKYAVGAPRRAAWHEPGPRGRPVPGRGAGTLLTRAAATRGSLAPAPGRGIRRVLCFVYLQFV